MPRDEALAAHPLIHTRTTGTRSWFDFGFREMWQFRGLLPILAIRDFKLRYRQTALGVAGVVIGPLLTAGVLTFVFGQVAKLPSEGVPYFAFSYAGFLGWNLFSNLLGRASGSLLGNSALVSKIYVPRLLLPISGIFVGLVDLGIASIVMVALMIAYRIAPGAALLLVPFWIAIILLLALGLGAAAGALIVHYRDVGLAISVGLSTLLYVSPVAYSADAVPARFRDLYLLNPIAAPLEGLRWSLIGSHAPTLGRVLASVVTSVAVLVVGCAFFMRLERSLADVI